ncbi:MAG: flagellar protein FlgN [Clostridiales bacterium]|nr:flagellar protein FlgN [Clostridiales bacterium]
MARAILVNGVFCGVTYLAGLINELIDILKKQAVNYDELLILSREKRRVIINNDTQMLQKITQAENSIIGRNQRMENKRLEIIKDIAIVLNQKADELTLSSLAELIKEQGEYQELVTARKALVDILDDLKSVNDQNSKLLDNSLEYIDFTLNLVRSSFDDMDTYSSQIGKGSKSKPGDDGSFFDVKR